MRRRSGTSATRFARGLRFEDRFARRKSVVAVAMGLMAATTLATTAGCGRHGGARTKPTSMVDSPSAYLTAEDVAYQINPGHTGYTSFGEALSFPSSPTWSVKFPYTVSYPLIAGGKVFVVALNADNSSTSLYALDVATGATLWGPVSLEKGNGYSAIAYDRGKIFALAYSGAMRSFDAATGSPGWSVQLPPRQYAFSAPPTAANGIIYAGGSGSGSAVFAVDETSGNLLWTADVDSGNDSSPAVSFDAAGIPNGVYVSYTCQVLDRNPGTGSTIWRYDRGCNGGGGATPVYSNGSLYARNIPSAANGMIFGAANGALSSRAFKSAFSPAISASTGFFSTTER